MLISTGTVCVAEDIVLTMQKNFLAPIAIAFFSAASKSSSCPTSAMKAITSYPSSINQARMHDVSAGGRRRVGAGESGFVNSSEMRFGRRG